MLQPGEPFPCPDCGYSLMWIDLNNDRCPHCGGYFRVMRLAAEVRDDLFEKRLAAAKRAKTQE